MMYFLDTDVFIEAKNRHYGFDFCPAFWDWIDEQNGKGKVWSAERVKEELVAGRDELADWARDRGRRLPSPPDEKVRSSLGTASQWASGAGYERWAVSMFFQKAE